MSVLSHLDIFLELNRTPNPYDRRHPLIIKPLLFPLQPASIDLRMGDSYIKPVGGLLHREAGRNVENNAIKIDGAIVLQPEGFINVCTLEWIEIPAHLIGILVGKSGRARDGLQVESAGYVDPGYKGRPTLELKNLGPYMITLKPGYKIAQIRFEYLHTPATTLYGDPSLGSHYQGATEPEMGTPNRIEVTPRAELAAPGGRCFLGVSLCDHEHCRWMRRVRPTSETGTHQVESRSAPPADPSPE